jgi:hypothetical protein
MKHPDMVTEWILMEFNGIAQAGNRAGKTQPCMQMGEHGLE